MTKNSAMAVTIILPAAAITSTPIFGHRHRNPHNISDTKTEPPRHKNIIMANVFIF